MTRRSIGGSHSPKVLLILEDSSTLETYSRYFGSAGMWVSTATAPGVGLAHARELRPNLLVTDIRFGGRPTGVHLLRMVKQDTRTADVPVVVLTANTEAVPAETHTHADAILVKPVLPDVLLTKAQARLKRSTPLETSNAVALQPERSVRRKTSAARRRGRKLKPDPRRCPRDCPRCGSPLEWFARTTLHNVECDFYCWCLNGCGLYCYDRAARDWIKITG